MTTHFLPEGAASGGRVAVERLQPVWQGGRGAGCPRSSRGTRVLCVRPAETRRGNALVKPWGFRVITADPIKRAARLRRRVIPFGKPCTVPGAL